MEHLAHFGLSSDPFADTSSAEARFVAASQTTAEKRVLRGIQQGRGLVLLTGPVGSGKTTILRHLLEELEEDVWDVSLLVPVPGVSGALWVLDRFAGQLGMEERAGEPLPLLAQLYECLVGLRQEGRRVVLVIDEAQGLADREAAEMLRGLLNLEHDDERLLTLVLAGHGRVNEVLDRDPGLAERVDVRVCLEGLSPQESLGYLAHRLEAAGGSSDLFDPSSQKALASVSQGLPRKLNAVADNALFEASLAGRTRVEVTDVVRAARDLGLEYDASEAVQVESQGAQAEAIPVETQDQPRTGAESQPATAATPPVPVAAPGDAPAEEEALTLAELPKGDEIDVAFADLIES